MRPHHAGAEELLVFLLRPFSLHHAPLNAIQRRMVFHAALFGNGLSADSRYEATVSLMTLVQALVALDTKGKASTVRAAWLRVEEQAALATAARATGHDAGLDIILSALMGSARLPTGHASLAMLRERGAAWRAVAQRKGSPVLRGLVTRMMPGRRTGDLLALATNVDSLARECVSTQRAWEAGEGQGSRLSGAELEPLRFDAGDVALATPFALRRGGLISFPLPSITGRPSLLVRERDPLDRLKAWLGSVQADTEAARLRLEALELHYRRAEAALLQVRRPALLRRLVALSFQRWSLWAARTADLLEVDVSTAWRALGQAADLGLIVPVPTLQRSRGNAQLFTAPPWLILARMVPRARGRPSSLALDRQGLAGPLASESAL
jgi:hypothetical protein